MLPKQLTILIDSREKKPFPFPQTLKVFETRGASRPSLVTFKTKTVKMDAGDYGFDGLTGRCLIERKWSLNEIYGNCCTDDVLRFRRALARLRESTANPIVLLEETPAALARATAVCDNPSRTWDLFVREVANAKVQLFWTASSGAPGPRRVLAEQLLRVMLAYSFPVGVSQ